MIMTKRFLQKIAQPSMATAIKIGRVRIAIDSNGKTTRLPGLLVNGTTMGNCGTQNLLLALLLFQARSQIQLGPPRMYTRTQIYQLYMLRLEGRAIPHNVATNPELGMSMHLQPRHHLRWDFRFPQSRQYKSYHGIR